MVFLCLVLSVFATIPYFEELTGKVLFYMVSQAVASDLAVMYGMGV